MLLLIKYTLLYGIVLMLVALGGMFSEHSGIINIALEGIMVIGGVAGVLTLTMLPAEMPVFLVVLISVLVAALAGMVYSLLLAFASINLKADQTIGGTALNLLATAIAVVLAKNFSDSGSAKLNYTNRPFLFSIGGLELSIFVPALPEKPGPWADTAPQTARPHEKCPARFAGNSAPEPHPAVSRPTGQKRCW